MALPELVANSPVPGTNTALTTLGAAITSTSATTLTSVAAAPVALQAIGQFHFVIDSEIFIATAGASGTTWTVSRGAEGSTAATHLIGAGIFHYFTAEALLNLMSQNVGGLAAARAHRAATLSIASTWTKIAVDAAQFDPGGCFDVTTNHRYNCPYTGYYQINGAGGVSALAAGTTIQCRIYHNGVGGSIGNVMISDAGTEDISCNISDIVYCQAGDYLELYLYCSATLNLNADPYNYFSVSFVAPVGVAPLTPNTAARGTPTAATALASGWGNIPLNTLTYDPGSHISANKYTVPTAGYYQVNGSVAMSGGAPAAAQLTCAISVNGGSGTIQGTSKAVVSGTAGHTVEVGDVVKCVVGDTLGLQGYWGGSSWSVDVGGTATTFFSVVRVDIPTPPDSGSAIQAVPAPTGVLATDTANVQAAANLLTNGGRLIFQAGTYVLNIAGGGATGLYNGTTLVVPTGTTLQAGPNIATGAGNYVMFAPKSATPQDINVEGGGTFDGNRRNGNHGAGEVISAFTLTDVLRCKIEGPRFYNWRGEGVLFGWSTLGVEKVRVLGCVFQDCGVIVGGDGNVNPRQGVAFTGGKDIIVAGNHFDTIGAYAVDLESDTISEVFDNVVIGPNSYRNVGVNGGGGEVNVSNAGGATLANMLILDRMGASTPVRVNLMPISGNLARIVTKKRQSSDLALAGSATWADVSNTDFDITIPAQVGDIIRYSLNALVGGTATYTQLDVATIVAAAPVNYFSSSSATPNGAGAGAWRTGNNSSLNYPVGGHLDYVVQTGDLTTTGTTTTITLRLRYEQNGATAITIFASTGVCAALVAAQNLGPGW